jgi:flagellar biosynthetic protein FliR
MTQDSLGIVVAPGSIVGFLMALVRASVFVAIAPPFATRIIPTQVKVGFVFAIALATGPSIAPDQADLGWSALIAATATQAVTGLVLGFIAFMLFSAVQAAGSMIDLFGGFTLTPAMDPLNNVQAGSFGRIYQLLATTLLFATNGHLMMLKGFLGTFEVIPLTGLGLNQIGVGVAEQIGRFFLAAIEIAAPMLAALFLAEVVLGLLSRAAPLMNVFQLGFAFKILLTILLVGFALPLLPGAVTALTEDSIRAGRQLLGVG